MLRLESRLKTLHTFTFDTTAKFYPDTPLPFTFDTKVKFCCRTLIPLILQWWKSNHTPLPLPFSWEKRQQYVDCIRELRLRELHCRERMRCLKAGMASIIPIQTLCLFTPADIQMRLCGLPKVNLDFLKAHTMYQVGLMETDQHVQVS